MSVKRVVVDTNVIISALAVMSAVTAQATIIVTGDKEMLKVKRISGIEIFNPQQFCRKLKIK